MKKIRGTSGSLLLLAIVGLSALMGCGSPVNDAVPPTVVSTVPIQDASDAGINIIIKATFSEEMEPATIVAANFTLAKGAIPVSGTVTYDLPNKTAIFAPTDILATSSEYIATVTSGVKDLAGNALVAPKVWTFTTAPPGAGPDPVNLGTAGSFALLSKAGVSTVPASAITGDVGVSPAAETYLTGFSLTDAVGYAISPQVTGFLYAADMAVPTPSYMTTAISDMELAYTDAAGRTLPDQTELGAGEIGGLTLVPGLYKWSSGVGISTDVTISGAANDVWIFQIAEDLTVASGVSVILSGGAQARNIFWQIGSSASLGTTSHFEGNILAQTAITLDTGASMNGRALAQTAITLDQATVTRPVN